eukprot:TRINITY_DN33811_c0_g1_i1.p1 TRINITY_DN33811_c0_g1~~TRINITY_DN33811_c0_g1_i1.p1  ORF type:complete len:960 (+),score=176.40 TRINITY_DN33811_c0_g1_i1:53-2932(+)
MTSYAVLLLATSTVVAVDLPCDTRDPYEAPRDARMQELFEDKGLVPSVCSEGEKWLGSFGAQDAKKAFTREHNESMHWGTYRPHLYFGMKTKTAPSATVTGVMWQRERDTTLRHECKESDKLKKYGWNKHDGRTFGEQTITDKHHWVSLLTSFVKPKVLDTKSNMIWHQTVKATPHGKSHSSYAAAHTGPVQIFFYIGTDCDGSPSCTQNPFNLKTDMTRTEGALSLRVAEDTLHLSGVNLRDGFEAKCVESVEGIESKATQWEDDTEPENCNLVLFRVTASDPDVTLTAALLNGDDNGDDYKEYYKKGAMLFEQKFQRAFPKSLTEKELLAGQYAISNLVGGAGYWHGKLKVHSSNGAVETDPISLYSFVPSRSFFPRGFLWDEGFHLKAVLQFDKALAAESLTSWMLTMRGHADPTVCKGGWIPREQALGRAARSRVPDEFLSQDPNVANPPTLLSLVSSSILTKSDLTPSMRDHCKSFGNLAVGCSEVLYDQKILGGLLLPYMEAWSVWLVDSQEANKAAYFETGLEPTEDLIDTGLYTWRGRDAKDGRLVPMTLSSGLDDYPRSYWPSHHEAHLDLGCWVASSQTALAEIIESQGDEKATGLDTEGQKYRTKAHAAIRAIHTYHYDTEKNQYADRGLVSQRMVAEGTISDGAPVGSSVTIRRDVVVQCNDEQGRTGNGGIPIDHLAAMQQQQKWELDPSIKPKMRVKITKTLKFKKNNVIVWQGTRATVNKVPSRKGMVEVTSDTGVTFNVRLEEVHPLLNTRTYSDYCPDEFPTFMYPLGDGKGGLLTRSKIVSVEVPSPGLLTEHRGYVSFLPIFLHLLPYEGNEEHIDSIIAQMQDDSVFSDFGLRSLSTTSQIYMMENAPGDAPYWRGALWMNMNYLALEGLKQYSLEGSQTAAAMHTSLSRRISSTVVDSYSKTGFLFEHYDDINGLGQRSHPFSGWSALVVNILADKYA